MTSSLIRAGAVDRLARTLLTTGALALAPAVAAAQSPDAAGAVFSPYANTATGTLTAGSFDGGFVSRLSPKLQDLDAYELAAAALDAAPPKEVRSPVPLMPMRPIESITTPDAAAVIVNPEPSTIALVAGGALALFGAARRRARGRA